VGARASRPGAPDDDRVVRILLVDDVLPFIELLKNYLKRTTCRLLTARTGAQALKLCRQDPPDLVLLDAAMPEMDGASACRFLKADPVLGRIPIVILAPQDRRDDCVRAGCDEVLIKPFESAAFLEVVRRFVPLLERREQRIPVSCRVEFRAKVGSYTAYTRDLSAHGLFLKSPRPFAVGTRLQMVIHLPGRSVERPPGTPGPLALEGEVRRVVRPAPGSHLLPGIGIRFLDPPPEVVRAIEEFIAARRAR
jgi:CheY-like chemotaxis protein/Tfp pilus assembly protein PilZ